MKNTLIDLNNHLFEMLERLNDDDVVGENLEQEIARAKAMTGVANMIIENANLELKVLEFKDERLNRENDIPRMLIGNGE